MVMTPQSPKPADAELGSVRVRQFFEDVPPGREVAVKELAGLDAETILIRLKLPWLQLHCDSTLCEGTRFFWPQGDPPTLLHEKPPTILRDVSVSELPNAFEDLRLCRDTRA
jgi:hypothetical protein